jgi:hypothetical protein
MRSKLMSSVVVAAAVLVFSAAPGMVGLAAAKDRGATVRGSVPAKQDATGSTSTQTKARGNQPTLDSSIDKKLADADKAVVEKKGGTPKTKVPSLMEAVTTGEHFKKIELH